MNFGLQMAGEISDPGSVVLNHPFHERSIILKDFDSFLDAVIKPVHEIIAAVRFRNPVRGNRFMMKLSMCHPILNQQPFVGFGTRTCGFLRNIMLLILVYLQ